MYVCIYVCDQWNNNPQSLDTHTHTHTHTNELVFCYIWDENGCFGIEKGREWCLCRGTEIGQIDVMKCCNDDEEKEWQM